MTDVRGKSWRQTRWHREAVCDNCGAPLPKLQDLWARTGSIASWDRFTILCCDCHEACRAMEVLYDL